MSRSFKLVESIQSNLNEKINKDNIDINDKIRKSLRSKGEARKNEPEFKKYGIDVDYSYPQGTALTGPNGRRLYDDKKSVHGPKAPGFSGTHDKRDTSWAKSNDRYAKEYQNKVQSLQDTLSSLENMERDDIIRKYNDLSTEEALAQHKKDIESTKNNIASWQKMVKDQKQDAIYNRKKGKRTRRRGHVKPDYDANIIDKTDTGWRGDKPSTADKVDYLNYLTKKDTGYRNRDNTSGFYDNAYDSANDMNKMTKEYSKLKGREDDAKRHLDFENKYYGVKSDDELNKQAEEIRAKAEKEIEDKKKENEKNKVNVANAETNLATAAQRRREYMDNLRASRAKK